MLTLPITKTISRKLLFSYNRPIQQESDPIQINKKINKGILKLDRKISILMP